MTHQKHESLSIRAAQQLTITTNTPPQIPSLTPRWVSKLLKWINVENGIYRVNKVRQRAIDWDRKLVIARDVDRVKEMSVEYFCGLLNQVSLFRGIPDTVVHELAKSMSYKKVKAGELIVKEGSDGDAFYIILGGQFEVSVKNTTKEKVIIKSLSGGDYFGELSLLEEVPRNATIVSTTVGELLVLDKKSFLTMTNNASLKSHLDAELAERKKALLLLNEYGESQIPLISGHYGEPIIPQGYADYDVSPVEIHLEVVQSILSMHTRVTDLYNTPHNQLEQQLKIVLENINERIEWEIINNKSIGLLNNVSVEQVIHPLNGAPTPDDLDALIALVWKKPTFFIAHPETIAAFGRECTFRGVPPVIVEILGAKFISWRGLPLIPCNKVRINTSTKVPTSDIILIRTGEQDQGVVGLHKNNLGDSDKSFFVQSMGINNKSIANYLVSKYFSLAVLVPDALAVMKNVEIGHYHSYNK